MGTEEGPCISSPGLPLSPMPGSEHSIQDPGDPKTQVSSASREGTQHHPGLRAVATATHKMEGCPQALPEPGGPSSPAPGGSPPPSAAALLGARC